jgi:hypothetical protein
VTVVPPDIAVWYDLEATTDAVLARLRLTEADVDTEQIKQIIPAAGVLIDEFLDRVDAIVGPPPPAPIQYVLITQVDRMYRAKDIPIPPALAPDLQAILRPWKQRHGLA